MATDLRSEIVYPCSDGKPMADNTLQYEWMVTIKEGTEAVHRKDANVFVAADLIWYPVEGEPRINIAPDILIAFGRPRGFRMSYKQWEEGGIAPQVVFEILSPSNDTWEMMDKYDFYDTYGVEEYYIWDPLKNRLSGYLRKGTVLRRIPKLAGWTSPRLNIRFELNHTLTIFGPDGERFLTYAELYDQRLLDRERAEQEKRRAEQEKQRAEQEQHRAEQAQAEVERLRAFMREKGIDPEKGSS